MITAVSYAVQVLGVLPNLIEAGLNIYEFISETKKRLSAMIDENRDPTQEEWDELSAKIEELRAQLPEV